MTRGLALATLACTPVAAADTPAGRPAATDVDRDDAPAGRTELGFDGGAPLDGWGLTLSGGWLESPARFTDTVPVRRRETIGLGAAIALGTAVVLDGRFAVAHQVGDRLRPGDPRPLDRYVPGDLRFGARLRVAGSTTRAVFVRGDVTLPSGDDRDFAGEGSWSLAWHLIGRATIEGVTIAASAGIRFRGTEVLVGEHLVGDELSGALGVAVPLPPVRPLWCVSDQVKLTGELVAILGDDIGMGRGPSPVEARLGVVTRPLPSLTIGVRAGRGLSDELGAPEFRAVLELTYQGTARLMPAEQDTEGEESPDLSP